MIPYLVAGSTTLIVVALTAMNIFAYRAGKNAAQLHSEQQDTERAQEAIRIAQHMAQAEANKPTSTKQLIQQLEKENI